MSESLISMKFLRAKYKCPVLNEKQIIKFLTTAAVQKLKPPDIFKGTSQHTSQSLVLKLSINTTRFAEGSLF